MGGARPCASDIKFWQKIFSRRSSGLHTHSLRSATIDPSNWLRETLAPSAFRLGRTNRYGARLPAQFLSVSSSSTVTRPKPFVSSELKLRYLFPWRTCDYCSREAVAQSLSQSPSSSASSAPQLWGVVRAQARASSLGILERDRPMCGFESHHLSNRHIWRRSLAYHVYGALNVD
jgi:hypothetical protein